MSPRQISYSHVGTRRDGLRAPGRGGLGIPGASSLNLHAWPFRSVGSEVPREWGAEPQSKVPARPRCTSRPSVCGTGLAASPCLPASCLPLMPLGLHEIRGVASPSSLTSPSCSRVPGPSCPTKSEGKVRRGAQGQGDGRGSSLLPAWGPVPLAVGAYLLVGTGRLRMELLPGGTCLGDSSVR